MNTFILYTEGTTKVDLSSVNNKIGVLDDVCIYANVYRCLDSNDMLTLKILCSEENNIYKQVSKKQIIMTYINGRYIPYVICSLEKDLDEINIVCRQWTIETTKSMFIKDAKPRDLNGLAMLDWLKMHCEEYGIRQYATDLEVGSNISTLGSSNLYYCDMYECVNKLSELYGAEINRDGFKIELVDFRGSKTPKYTIEYGENLLSNTQFEKYDYATGCYASGFDGIKSPIVYSGKLATNKNLLGQTIEIQTKVRVRTNSSSEEDGDYLYFNTEEEAIQELTKIAKERMEKGGIDEPIVEFETKFIDLALTEEYKEIISKTFLEVGDTVRVKINKYNNLDINVRVYEWNFNPLTQEIGDITLSNNDIKLLTPPTISSISKEVEKLPSIDEVIETARKESEAIVNQGFNGFVHYKPNYTAWTDTEDIKQSLKGLCANKNGWFFYSKGINPETGVPNPDGSTMIADVNGNFNCSVLNSGQINASLIKAGILENADGSFQINMEGTEGALFRNDGKDAIRIVNNKIDLFNWAINGDRIGSIGSLYDSTNKVAVMSMYNDLDSVVTLGYNKSGSNSVGTYMEFDKYGLRNDATYPIQAWENMRCNRDLKVEGTLRTDYIKPRSDNSAMLIDCTNLTVTGNIYASNVGRAATMALEKDSNEEYRLVTKGELMSEIEQLKAQIKQLKALVVK